MDGVEAIVIALMRDAMDLRRIGEDAARAVADRGVVLPASFPELVDHLHIFVRDVVAVVMRGLLVLAGAARGAVEIAGHDVPADAPLGQVIERRHPPRKRIGRLEGEVGSDAEAEMPGHRGHRGDQQQRLIRRRLRRVFERSIRAVAVDVVDPEHVGEEQAVEAAALQRPRQVEPVGQAVIFGGAVARMGPQPRRLVRHAVHGEGVEPDFLGHDFPRDFWLAPGLIAGLLAEIAAFRLGLARQIRRIMFRQPEFMPCCVPMPAL